MFRVLGKLGAWQAQASGCAIIMTAIWQGQWQHRCSHSSSLHAVCHSICSKLQARAQPDQAHKNYVLCCVLRAACCVLCCVQAAGPCTRRPVRPGAGSERHLQLPLLVCRQPARQPLCSRSLVWAAGDGPK
jgi:hypothetical protein